MNSADNNSPNRRLLQQLETATAKSSEETPQQPVDQETQKLRETWVEFGGQLQGQLLDQELRLLERITAKELDSTDLDVEAQMLRDGWDSFASLMSKLDVPAPRTQGDVTSKLAVTQVAPAPVAVPPSVPSSAIVPPPVQSTPSVPPVQPPPVQLPRVTVTRGSSSRQAAPWWGWVAMAAAFLMAAGLGWYALNMGNTRVAESPEGGNETDVDNNGSEAQPATEPNVVPNTAVVRDDTVVEDPGEGDAVVEEHDVEEPGAPGMIEPREQVVQSNSNAPADPYAWDSDLDNDLTTARQSLLVFENRWQRWENSSLAVDYELNSFSERFDDGSL